MRRRLLSRRRLLLLRLGFCWLLLLLLLRLRYWDELGGRDDIRCGGYPFYGLRFGCRIVRRWHEVRRTIHGDKFLSGLQDDVSTRGGRLLLLLLLLLV